MKIGTKSEPLRRRLSLSLPSFSSGLSHLSDWYSYLFFSRSERVSQIKREVLAQKAYDRLQSDWAVLGDDMRKAFGKLDNQIKNKKLTSIKK
jgi:hypothetical protein